MVCVSTPVAPDPESSLYPFRFTCEGPGLYTSNHSPLASATFAGSDITSVMIRLEPAITSWRGALGASTSVPVSVHATTRSASAAAIAARIGVGRIRASGGAAVKWGTPPTEPGGGALRRGYPSVAECNTFSATRQTFSRNTGATARSPYDLP